MHPARDLNQRRWNDFISENYARVRGFDPGQRPDHSNCSIVLIEPRRHPHLEFVLRNALFFLGPHWSVTWFHGSGNIELVQEMHEKIGPITAIDLGVKDLDTREYNKLKKQAWTWENVPSENIMWLEPDCLICRKGIDEYFAFDYIGAPWKSQYWMAPNCRIGNGGLSFRRRSAMLEIASNCNPSHQVVYCEDMYFAMNMSMRNRIDPGHFNLPDYETARSFSVESIWHPRPLGLHKTWNYLKTEYLRTLLGNLQREWDIG
jgi:hypothetical protein